MNQKEGAMNWSRISRMLDSARFAVLVVSAGIGMTTFAQPAPTQVITVTNLADSGPGSLRQAIGAANAAHGGEIHFANGLAGAIVLTGGELRITANVAIVGPGADTLTISGTVENPTPDLPSLCRTGRDWRDLYFVAQGP
jgi:hypothetical protein